MGVALRRALGFPPCGAAAPAAAALRHQPRNDRVLPRRPSANGAEAGANRHRRRRRDRRGSAQRTTILPSKVRLCQPFLHWEMKR